MIKLSCLVGSAGVLSTLAMLLAVGTGGTISVNAAGTVKDAVLTYLGFAYLGDAPSTMLCIGLAVNAAG